MEPDIRYARSSGAAIAYHVVGSGPVDLVLVPSYISNLVYGWEWPRYRHFYERLASFSRLILFDKRGTGLSDHTGAFPTLETRMEDVRAVLDAVDSRETVVFGSQEGCSMAALFAATYPERTRALVLFQPLARVVSSPDFVGMISEAEARYGLEQLREQWGTQEYADSLLAGGAPSLATDDEERRFFANWLRTGASPAAAYALNRMYLETDLRDVFPAVRVPTLALYRGSDQEAVARDATDRIADVTVVRLPGDGFFGYEVFDEIADEIRQFVEGAERPREPERVLTTILFTDLVGSTARAVELGDHRWRDLLERHHATIRREIGRYRGSEVDTAGDGVFAVFDGPARAIRCADAIRSSLRDLDLDVRSGVHTGEAELVDGKPAGIAVHTGARISAFAAPSEILVSSTVKDLVAGSGIAFEDRGPRTLKGIPEELRLFAVAAV